MADEFERFLSDALAPEARDPDRLFVARVQARIALDRRFAAERRSLVRQLGVELLGIGAIAVALLWLGRAAPIAGFVAESPAVALGGLLSLFALAVWLFSQQRNDPSFRKVELRANSMA